jgi:hypothetical protein
LIKGGSVNLEPLRQKITTFSADGRASIVDLYHAQSELARNPGWISETVFQEELTLADGSGISLPSTCIRTKRNGPALWVLTGIHGEEPAGPNALAEKLKSLVALEKRGIPMVVFPLLNPLGYQRNWRYPDAAVYSKEKPGSSVGDSDHYLPNEKGKVRSPAPVSRQAGFLTAKVLELAGKYPPVLSLDLHEDNLLREGYIYSQGPKGAKDRAAAAVVDIFRRNGSPIMLQGKTRFDEAVKSGIVSGVQDGSIDELLSSRTIILNGRPAPGPAGKSILVLETSSMNAGIQDRKKVHAVVIDSLPNLWKQAVRFSTSKDR